MHCNAIICLHAISLYKKGMISKFPTCPIETIVRVLNLSNVRSLLILLFLVAALPATLLVETPPPIVLHLPIAALTQHYGKCSYEVTK